MTTATANETLKYENLAEVGDTIRSYDFHGVTNCYIEGIVMAKGLVFPQNPSVMVYEIVATKVIRSGINKEERVGTTYYVPMEVSFMEYDGRVVKV